MSQPSNLVPFIPDNAPFSEEQRAWLNGFLAGLYSSASANGVAAEAAEPGRPLTILWGSQTGNAESLAKKTAKEAGVRGFNAEVFDMEAYPQERLPQESNLLVITSTYGEGDPPDNAEALHRFIMGDEAPRLEAVNFSVLGLGDSNYPDFNQCAKEFDTRFEALGAKRAAPGVWCDVDFDDDYTNWLGMTFDALANGSSNGVAPAVEDSAEAETSSNDAPAYSRKNPFPAKLLRNANLNRGGSAKETRHVEICLKDSGLVYEAGDALGVVPRNCPQLVDEVLKASGFTGEEVVPGADGGSEVPLKEALSCHYDITALGKGFLKDYANLAKHTQLDEILASANGHIDDYLNGRHLIDSLIDFPVRFASATDLVSMLKKLAPRLYSISSSPKAHEDQVHLTVGVVRYESHGRARKGVCSTFLAELEPGGEVGVFVQPNKHFKPPVDPALPMIMVGPGTGIAPFRAFLEERHATGTTGQNWLFFGDQRSEYDFLYAGQLKQLQEDGCLHRLDTAFSRDGAEKVYVQHRMLEYAAELFQWLEQGAYFYVCGDASRMAKDVDAALRTIIQEQGKLTDEQADAYLDQLKSQKRYLRDVY